MTLGLTGGMGCGKSTAARMFENKGFGRLDSDALVREQVLPSPGVKEALRQRHGGTIFKPDGSVDRGKLAYIVFSDDSERTWLEELTHPLVFGIWRSALGSDPAASWVLETPLLFEKALENWFDFTVCVACAPEQQLVRLEQRGLNRELAGQRISKQLPLARKIELSDFVLWNEGSPEFLQEQIDRLVVSLRG